MRLLFALAAIALSAAGLAAQATRVGGELQVSPDDSNAHFRPDVAVGADGRFVVVWTWNEDQGIFARRYNSSGDRAASTRPAGPKASSSRSAPTPNPVRSR